MYCVRNVTPDLVWVGASDRRLALFEGVYGVPEGVSYNSYLLTDEKTVLFDTVDKAVAGVFFENIEYVLAGRGLDYVVVHHMEPDHSATLAELLRRYPEATVICNAMIKTMIGQFFTQLPDERYKIVKEGDTFSVGRHELTFLMAPMVHWPEVMISYDKTDKVLFSADAFGIFGALNGALFDDEVEFERDCTGEARRYYCNIVGKYGPQVQSLLKKASAVEIKLICPLHGLVYRSKINYIIEKYDRWSRYEPEETGVMIAYASVYGNTANAADILACRLRELGVKTTVFDVSVTPASRIVAESFRYSHLVFASTTYNMGIFVEMEDALRDVAAHNLQNRTVAIVENGSWAPNSGKLMREIIAPLKNITLLDETVTIKSSVKAPQHEGLYKLAAALTATIKIPAVNVPAPTPISGTALSAPADDPKAIYKLPYGLFLLTAASEGRDNGCIINTVIQVTESPKQFAFAVNKSNLTAELIAKTGVVNISVLAENAPFEIYRRFGFQSGRDIDKFAGYEIVARSVNGLYYLAEFASAVLSGKVVSSVDCGTHMLYIAELTWSAVLSDKSPVTYEYYRANIKPKPKAAGEQKKGFVCTVCGYVYEGDTLPPDFICPICKHGTDVFEPLA
jgi:Uncharacterized flavoproteins